MSKDYLLQDAVQSFIKSKVGIPISEIALQKNPFPEIDWKLILEQIESREKSKTKLPSWFSREKIIYPPKISIEQTSSEETARYKASLVQGDTLIDLTGGFGVDCYYFAQKIKSVFHCEQNLDLSEIVASNFKNLGINNVKFYKGNSNDFIHNIKEKTDWIYIDPSRRNSSKGKVFLLQDCEPNVPEMLETYFEISSNILLKTAPLLDISAGLKEIQNCKEIHIVALNNEVKELLWVLEKNFTGHPLLKTINLNNKKEEVFEFYLNQNRTEPIYSEPLKYLYEPNAAIMKSGGFKELALAFNLYKLHPNSHLYTSNELVPFCGRVFEINHFFDYQKNNMKTFLQNTKANITTRNFPETVENLKKKWKINDGGTDYCFFTTYGNELKIVLLCKKI
ncbi:THUMP-like domain-containing protein [Flavobacterium sp.]|uniref:THUMP-like domain-containing protein n=1 Tax=Flavobacterium sp. TaxID=239 RepID=UPI002FD935E2